MRKGLLFFGLSIILLMVSLNTGACTSGKKNTSLTPPDNQIIKFTDRFSIQVGSKSFSINEEKYELNAPVVEIDGHSYLPLRFFLDYFEAENIAYNEKTEEITFILPRFSEINKEKLNQYLPTTNNNSDPDNHNALNEESYESYKSLYIQSMTESYKGMAVIGFDDNKKAFTLTPENDLLGMIMLAIDGNQSKINSWNEFIKAIITLSSSIKTTLSDHSVIVLNPIDPADMFLHVKNGEVIFDILKK